MNGVYGFDYDFMCIQLLEKITCLLMKTIHSLQFFISELNLTQIVFIFLNLAFATKNYCMKHLLFKSLLTILVFNFIACQSDDISLETVKEEYSKVLKVYDTDKAHYVNLKITTQDESDLNEINESNFTLDLNPITTEVKEVEMEGANEDEINISELTQVQVEVLEKSFDGNYALIVRTDISRALNGNFYSFYDQGKDCVRILNLSNNDICGHAGALPFTGPWVSLTTPFWVHIPPVGVGGHVTKCFPLNLVLRAWVIAPNAASFSVTFF